MQRALSRSIHIHAHAVHSFSRPATHCKHAPQKRISCCPEITACSINYY